MLNAYITNLAAYVNGELKGEWLHLPASNADIKQHLSVMESGRMMSIFYRITSVTIFCMTVWENMKT